MKDVKFVKIDGNLDVIGIYNYNKSGGKDGNNNHKHAKKDNNNIDFTSSRCIRHEIFKDIQPQQPANAEFSNFFLNLVSSEIGLLRGFFDPDTGHKRSSPLHIADAYTKSNESVIFYDQGSSSKQKEKDTGKNKKGEEKSDTSIFSQDNAPKRVQILNAAINLKELQFLHLDEKDPSFRMVSEKDEKEFIKKLSKYFEGHGVDSIIEPKKYKDKSSILQVPRHGCLLNQSQISHLVKIVISRIASINGLKAGASIKTDESSLRIIFSNGEDEKTYNFSKNIVSDIKDIDYHIYYEAV